MVFQIFLEALANGSGVVELNLAISRYTMPTSSCDVSSLSFDSFSFSFSPGWIHHNSPGAKESQSERLHLLRRPSKHHQPESTKSVSNCVPPGGTKSLKRWQSCRAHHPIHKKCSRGNWMDKSPVDFGSTYKVWMIQLGSKQSSRCKTKASDGFWILFINESSQIFVAEGLQFDGLCRKIGFKHQDIPEGLPLVSTSTKTQALRLSCALSCLTGLPKQQKSTKAAPKQHMEEFSRNGKHAL